MSVSIVKKNTVLVIMGLSCVNLSIISNAAMYAPPPSATEPEPISKGGFYVGIGAGGIGLIENITASVSSTSGDGYLTTGQDAVEDNGGIGVIGTIFAGYSWYLPKKLFLSAEIFGDYTHTPVTESDTETADMVTISHSGTTTLESVYGARLLPGYQVADNAVVYGIVGYARSHVNESSNGFNASDSRSDTTLINWPAGESTTNYNGYQLGIGSMIDVAKHFAVRGDIIYTGYPSISNGPASFKFPDGQTGSAFNTIEQFTIEGDVSLVYLFD